jgi:hypothetical protein
MRVGILNIRGHNLFKIKNKNNNNKIKNWCEPKEFQHGRQDILGK